MVIYAVMVSDQFGEFSAHGYFINKDVAEMVCQGVLMFAEKRVTRHGVEAHVRAIEVDESPTFEDYMGKHGFGPKTSSESKSK